MIIIDLSRDQDGCLQVTLCWVVERSGTANKHAEALRMNRDDERSMSGC